MRRPHPGPAQRLAWSRPHSGTAHDGLAGTNRSAKDRLAGGWRTWRSTGPGSAGSGHAGARLLTKTLLQVGTRRHSGPRGRCETGAAGRTRRDGRIRSQPGTGLAGRRRAAWQRRTGNSARRRGRAGSDQVRRRLSPRLRCGSRVRTFGLRKWWPRTLRQGSPRTGRLGRRGQRAGGNGDGPVRGAGRSERRMQRGPGTQRRPQRLALGRWGGFGDRRRFGRRRSFHDGGAAGFGFDRLRRLRSSRCFTNRSFFASLYCGGMLRMAIRARVGAVPLGAVRGTCQTRAQLNRYILFDGTRVRLLLLHSQFRQEIEYNARLHFKLARQLVDSDFLHRGDCWVTP